MLVPNCFDYCSFAVILKSGNVNPLTLFIFSRLLWLFRIPWVSVGILELACPFLKKKDGWNFDRCCIESIGQLGEYCYLNNIKSPFLTILSLLIYEHWIGFHLFRSSLHSPLLSAVALSMVSVTCGQPQSENIRWKIPEINTSYVLNCMLFSMEWWTLMPPYSMPPGSWIIPLSSVSTLYMLPAH